MRRIAELPESGPWPGVVRAIERAASPEDLWAHRLGPLSSFHVTQSGAPGSPKGSHAELRRMAHVVAVRRTLKAVVDAVADPVVLFKGLSVASRYPRPDLRTFGDLDLLVGDPERAHRSMIDAGFLPCGDHEPEHFVGLQHLQPLAHPDHGSIPVEIHAHVSWVSWCPPPSSRDIIDAAVPAAVGVDGVLEPDPAHHALIVAAHSAESMSLRCIGDLLDFDLLSSEADLDRQWRAAEAWGVGRLLALYRDAADALLYGAPPSLPLRLWAPSLLAVRDATVIERHVRNWLSPIWVRRRRDIARGIAAAVINDVRPADGETWSDKRSRLRTGGRNWRRPLSEHTRELGDAAIRPRHRRRSEDERVDLPGDPQRRHAA